MRLRLPHLAAALLLATAARPAPGQTITTVAGTGGYTFSPDGSPAATSSLALATDGMTNVLFDDDGNMMFSEVRACRVRRIVRKTGVLETVAGTTCGYSGDGGKATAARLKAPAEIAFDRKGNLFIGDAGNNLVRRVDKKTGIITTVIGNRAPNYTGDGIATEVPIGRPSGLVFDRDGRLVVVEVYGSRIRRWDPRTLRTETIAGKNEMFFTGGPALETGFAWPNSPRFDRAGALYFVASGNNQVLKLDAKGETVTHVAGTGEPGFSGDGGPASAAALAVPIGLGLDGKGNLYVVDAQNYRIRKIEGVAAR